MDYGLKVSPPGVEVLTAADKDLAFSSKFFGMKILMQGTITVSGGSGTTGTVAHGLAYAPGFICFPVAAGQDAVQVNETNLSGGESGGMFLFAWSDTTNLNVKITNAGTAVFKYYIFVEDAD